ncbi:DUF3885 domain-containing protein [Psychrobacillus sp. NPDC096426]
MDRGCDLIATFSESTRTMYDTYKDWIIDFDREKKMRCYYGEKNIYNQAL